tara:strand:- start:337 stop:450 length:114 start_codon:yes stop_codon:yes gene_type:complete
MTLVHLQREMTISGNDVIRGLGTDAPAGIDLQAQYLN